MGTGRFDSTHSSIKFFIYFGDSTPNIFIARIKRIVRCCTHCMTQDVPTVCLWRTLRSRLGSPDKGLYHVMVRWSRKSSDTYISSNEHRDMTLQTSTRRNLNSPALKAWKFQITKTWFSKWFCFLSISFGRIAFFAGAVALRTRVWVLREQKKYLNMKAGFAYQFFHVFEHNQVQCALKHTKDFSTRGQ